MQMSLRPEPRLLHKFIKHKTPLLFMKTSWLTIPLVLIGILITVFLLAFFLNQPKINEADTEFFAVGDDEYLDLDYISPEEEGIGEFGTTNSPSEYFVAEQVEECEAFENQDKNDCYALYSIFNDNEDGCGFIDDSTQKDDCYSQIAFVKKDASLCENIITGAPECYASIAIETNDASLCEKAGLEKRQCFVAAQTGNIDDCDNGLQSRFCKDAAVAKDPSICNEINDLGEFCYQNVAINTNTSSLCNKAGIGKDHCFFKIATTINNAAICENLTDTRDNCVAWVAFNTGNTDLCFEAGTETQSCLQDLA